MPEKLKVTFDDPADGWVQLKVWSNNEVVRIVAGYTPYDSFRDLVDALYNRFLYEGESKVIWNAQPIEFELRFGRSGSVITLDVLEFPCYRRYEQPTMNRLSSSGSYDEIAVPFWRALRNLQGRLSTEELRARWHRDIPAKEIEGLTSLLRKAC